MTLVAIGLFAFVVAAHAQGSTYEITNPLGVTNLEDIITKVSSAILNLAIPVAVVMYLYAGFLFLTAGAKPGNIETAKKVMLYTTIGLAVIYIGGGFVSLIKSVLNLGQ